MNNKTCQMKQCLLLKTTMHEKNILNYREFYSSYPVPFLPMNMHIQPVQQMCQESSLPSADMEPE